MATIQLDTYRFIQQLHQSGMPEEQAKALADQLQQIDMEHLVTRKDLEIAVSSLKAEIFSLKADILKWVIPLLLGQTAVFAAIVKWL